MDSADPEFVTTTMSGRVLQRLSSMVWWLVVSVLVLLALYVGIGRQLTQNVDQYRAGLEARLTEATGYQVRIGSLQARWHWLDPVIEARNVEVRTLDELPITLGRLSDVRLRLDSLTSLVRFRLVFEKFEADGLDLMLVQSQDGRLALEGLTFQSSDSASIGPQTTRQNWFGVIGRWLSDPSVRITRVSLGLRARNGQLQHFEIPQLDLHYEQGLFSASGRAMRAGTTHQLVSFNLLGLHFFRGDFTGQMHLNLNSGRLFDELMSEYQWRGMAVEGFDVGGDAWLTFRQGLLEQINGQLRVPYLQLRADGRSLAPIEDLALDFGWRGSVLPLKEGLLSGELHVRDIQWQWLGESVSGFSVAMRRRDDRIDAWANGVPLAGLSRLSLSTGLLPEPVSDALEGYQPEGRLNDLVLTLPASDQGPDFRLAASLDGVGVKAFHGAPNLSGAKGSLVAGQTWGQIRVAGPDVRLGFPQLYAQDWDMRYAEAEVSWRMEGGLTRVYAEDIRLQYGEETELTGAFDLRMDREGEDNLGLKVEVSNGNADMLAAFVPAKVVNPGLYEWLTTAIGSARIESGVYYGHGQINRDAPRHSFTSSMRYRFSDGQIRYDAAWPEVTEAAGTVMVHDGKTVVNLESGRTGGLELSDARVRVEPGDERLTLMVDAQTTVPGSALDYWFENSPLGNMAGEAANSVSLGGDYLLNLGLAIPLAGDGKTWVNASVDTNNGSVRYPQANLEWTDITGSLRFDSGEGFSYDTVSARFWDQPVNMGIEYDPDNETLSISQTGQLTVEQALSLTKIPEETQTGLDGGLSYTARLDLSHDGESGLSLYSSLLGLAIDWPEPFAKPADKLQPLTARLSWEPGAELDLHGVWDQRLAFHAMWGRQGFDRAGIELGSKTASLPSGPGIALSGRVARLNIDEWVARVNQLLSQSDAARSDSAPADYNDVIDGWLDGINLSVQTLEVSGQTISDINVKATFQSGDWRIATRSDQATGRIVIPMDPRRTVDVQLQSLKLERGQGEDAESSAPVSVAEQVEAFRALGMGAWPDVRVEIDTLTLDERPLGRWSFLLLPEVDDLHIKSLSGELDSLTFTGDMWWGIHDNQPVSRLAGVLAGEDLGDLAVLVGSQAPLRNEKSQIEMDVSWPGRPDDFRLPQVQGEVSIRLDDGVILESNYTAQLFRLFNVLNADNLWRRLQLDFSDLYEAGVAFDAISGTALLDSGSLSWQPELQIVGPSGAFKLSGTTDMVAESLDMRLVVVLPLTQNLPLAAILMGASAPIGGALFVLDKVLGDPLSKLTSATYTVQGSWDQPEVRLRNVFDTGG